MAWRVPCAYGGFLCFYLSPPSGYLAECRPSCVERVSRLTECAGLQVGAFKERIALLELLLQVPPRHLRGTLEVPGFWSQLLTARRKTLVSTGRRISRRTVWSSKTRCRYQCLPTIHPARYVMCGISVKCHKVFAVKCSLCRDVPPVLAASCLVSAMPCPTIGIGGVLFLARAVLISLACRCLL